MSIVNAWCDMCEHLQPFAVLALVPLLLWIHHFETYPPADVQESLITEPTAIHGSGITGSRHIDELEGRWAA